VTVTERAGPATPARYVAVTLITTREIEAILKREGVG
jgi:hypothetical protein